MNNQDAFFVLLRVGLWETVNDNVNLDDNLFEGVDWGAVQKLAEEQSVVGLVATGLEHVKDCRVPQRDLLVFAGTALQIEQRNLEINKFIAYLIEELRQNDVSALLLKGQGVAQCYERPLWRTSGDVDLFLNEANYESAKALLLPLASDVEPEGAYTKHLGMTIDGWTVELHGTLRCGLSRRIDKKLVSIRDDVFYNCNVRLWQNGDTQVFLPSADNDAIYIFTHILNHFYKGGIGLRQICDWCRLLWTCQDSINQDLLKNRLCSMGLMTEWKAFGAFAVEYLGMPCEAIPFYSSDAKWKRKAHKICDFILEVGNFGHNRDMSYFNTKPYFVRKTISFGHRCGDLVRHARIFPLDSIRFMPSIVFNGVRSAVKGE